MSNKCWDKDLALLFLEKIENLVKDKGWHVGLTGGCLYKDGYRKDVDVILYPDLSQSKLALTREGILDVLMRGMSLVRKSNNPASSLDYPCVVLCTKSGRRVDVLFMQQKKVS